ncbi:TPA: oxaloacetate decarboxylase subunit gamma [Vibrio cholerae]|uniref:oxaloacetate decarboxylase subunit gamma n=1 Tax=Vibrio metoecus TaxID=1481663 RepID=UPI0006D85F87|nr:oxaloacetate decarboxylase subunit gamma [Vibrio metoecus]KQA17871.1 oxaloacetate decarboxylase subunit gamma [Vibrio metoecus]HDZ3705856.1 oxaloacetate decarboxylase subunit gamma [Vibrio cholerae]HDZ3750810.1 oxaloacetate decarboxylase subunit gamma [Vibrio cholerae]HDZ3764730.1 oxaloacetate decarboxylase subunit gamma [Vibrio cholerae]
MIHIGSLLMDAATLMVTGMAVVFLFLTVLVYLVQLMSRLIPQEAPEAAVTPKKSQKVQPITDSVNPQVVAAISAAVHQYRAAAVKQ